MLHLSTLFYNIVDHAQPPETHNDMIIGQRDPRGDRKKRIHRNNMKSKP